MPPLQTTSPRSRRSTKIRPVKCIPANFAAWLPLAAVVPSLNALFESMIHGNVTLRGSLKHAHDARLNQSLPNGVSFGDQASFVAPLNSLPVGSATCLIASHILMIVGLLVSALLVCGAIPRALTPGLSAQKAAQRISAGFWIMLPTFAAFAVLNPLGTNLAFTHLGIPASAPGTIGWLVAYFGMAGALGLVRAIRRIILWGHAGHERANMLQDRKEVHFQGRD